MNKKAFILVVLLGITIIVGLLLDALPITIKGQEIHGPLHAVFGNSGSVIAIIILLYLALLSAPLLGCLAMIMMSVLAMVTFILLGIVLPLLLPALVLSLLLWANRSGDKKDARSETEKPANNHAEAKP